MNQIDMKQKVYLAGGMTGNWQQKVIESCQGFTFFNPCNHGQGEPALYTAWDLHFVRQCDIVFAYISEDNKSGYGAALEIGYAAALGKTVILCDERSPADGWFESKYAIVHCASTVTLASLSDGIKFLNRFAVPLI